MKNLKIGVLICSVLNVGPSIEVFDICGSPPVHVYSIDHITDATVKTNKNIRSHDLYTLNTSGTEGIIFDASMEVVSVFEYKLDSNVFSIESSRLHQFVSQRGQDPFDFPSNIEDQPNDNGVNCGVSRASGGNWAAYFSGDIIIHDPEMTEESGEEETVSTKRINNSELDSALIVSIQVHQALIDELEARIAELENMMQE